LPTTDCTIPFVLDALLTLNIQRAFRLDPVRRAVWATRRHLRTARHAAYITYRRCYSISLPPLPHTLPAFCLPRLLPPPSTPPMAGGAVFAVNQREGRDVGRRRLILRADRTAAAFRDMRPGDAYAH